MQPRTTIRIPAPLRSFTGGAGEVQVEAHTVAEALDRLGHSHEGILERVLDERGQLRGFVNVYVGERDIRSLEGLETRLEDAQVVSIIPAVAGGSR